MSRDRGAEPVFKRGIVVFHEWLIGAGGAERLAVEEYRYISGRGIPAWLLAFEASPRALFGLDPARVEVIPRKNMLDGIRRLRRRLLEIDPDVVIVAGGLNDLYLATLFTDVRYVLHQHEAPYKVMLQHREVLAPLLHPRAVREIRGTAFGYREIPVPPPVISPLKRLRLELLSVLDSLAVRKASAVLSLSRRAAREVELLHGRDAAALYGGFPSEMLAHQPKRSLREKLGLKDSRILLSISRLDAMKRIDVIIRAFALVAPKLADTVLVIGGTGPDEKHLNQLAEELGLAQRIVFLGFVPDDELWDDIATSDVFLCADWTDFDIAPYEALALGRRVVWTSEIEADEWLERNGAVFVGDPTPKGLAAAMERALGSPDVPRRELSEFLRRFTWESYFQQVLELAAGNGVPGEAVGRSTGHLK